MNVKEQKLQKMSVNKYTPSPIALFRKKWLKKGFELVDITQLCEFKLGNSGWCNEFNEPDENIYHVQVWYRHEPIGNINGINMYPIDDEKYVIFISDPDIPFDCDFIIFRKVKVD